VAVVDFIHVPFPQNLVRRIKVVQADDLAENEDFQPLILKYSIDL
jgi:hypothetical protein